MADVVEIARSRRVRLAAEIAKLDDFIRMAELLLRYGGGPGHGAGMLANDAGLIVPLAEFEADGGGSPQRAAAPDGEAAKETAGSEIGVDGPQAPDEAATAATDDASVPDKRAGRSDAGPWRADPGVRPPVENEELALTDRLSAEAQRVDAIVGLKLRQRRWMLGMTKKQLADKLGIEIEEIQKYECGAANIGTGRMWHLAAALEVPMSYFFETADGQSADTGGVHTASPAESEAQPPAREVTLARTA